MIMCGWNPAHQSGSTNAYQGVPPYQIHQPVDMCRRLPNLTKICARGANTIGAFGLVTSVFTIAYHSPDLGALLPRATFTKHHRLAITIGIICYENYMCGERM